MDLQMGIVMLLIVIFSCDAVEVKSNLTCTVGGSITLPDPVVELGFLLFERKNIAGVTQRKLDIYEDLYRDRLFYNNSTGLVTITELQKNDSGIYYIDSKRGRVFTESYKLTVYESVPTPAVNTLNVHTESCTLLCLVDKAEETTLLWYKDEHIVTQSSSTRSLHLTVLKKEFSSSYRCVAANPAEEKSVPVDITMSCGGQNKTDNLETEYWTRILMPIVSTVIIIAAITLAAFIIKRKYYDKKRPRHTPGRDDSQKLLTAAI